jgi:UDP-glucose 4-epimerase
MKIGITGALGHIGSGFVRALPVGMFDEVLLIDNLATQRYCTLLGLPTHLPCRFVEADICTADLLELFAGLDVIVHLAAITDAEGSVAIPDKVQAVNVEGTRRVAEACVYHDCRLVFVSTTSVYGVQKQVVDERCPEEELRPQSPYAHSKLAAERLLRAYQQRHGLRVTTCRFGTIFGVSPGMRFHTAVNKFSWQASLGQPLTVWSAAFDQQRPYLALSDAIDALLFLIKRVRFNRGLYNVVTTNATVRQIVRVLQQLIPDVTVTFVDSPIMNQLSYAVSSDEIRAEGFVFHGCLDAGVAETVALLRGLNRRAVA